MTHHWLDSTHVTFGVITVGVHDQRWKVEFSAFNGREPDESRVDLDLGSFDSIAGRLSFLPTERLSLQVSAARLREASTDDAATGTVEQKNSQGSQYVAGTVPSNLVMSALR